MNSPTKKQTLLLDFVAEFTANHDYSPSYREIMHAMKLKSVSAVAEHVENCVSAGFLKKVPKSARSLEVVKPETHEDSVKLFNKKLSELTTKNPDDPKINTLKKAAQILDLDL